MYIVLYEFLTKTIIAEINIKYSPYLISIISDRWNLDFAWIKAKKNHDSHLNSNLLELIIKFRLSPKIKMIFFPYLITLLVEVVAALLGVEGIQVNQKTPEGWTALVGAADKGHHSVVKKLLQHPNIDPNVRDKQGRQSCLDHFNTKLFLYSEISFLVVFSVLTARYLKCPSRLFLVSSLSIF